MAQCDDLPVKNGEVPQLCKKLLVIYSRVNGIMRIGFMGCNDQPWDLMGWNALKCPGPWWLNQQIGGLKKLVASAMINEPSMGLWRQKLTSNNENTILETMGFHLLMLQRSII